MSKDNYDISHLIKLGYQETYSGSGVWERAPKKPKVAQKSAMKQPKANKFNAKKITEDGITYDSKRELAFKHLLDLNGIQYKMQVRVVLQPKFKYNGKAVREIAMVPDYMVTKGDRTVAIVDVKGMITDTYKLKEKMLKCKLLETGYEVPIFTPNSKKQMEEVIREILNLINA